MSSYAACPGGTTSDGVNCICIDSGAIWTPEHGCENPPTPGDGPIDQNLLLLGLVAMSFGLYTIYKPTKKASN